MPIIHKSTYRAPFWLYSNHLETVVPSLFRKPKPIVYTRDRITTRDHDFLDLDFVINSKDRIVILSHGLEGHTEKPYMLGMAHKFIKNNWDVLSWNCRSCSRENNLTPKLYHHGATEDLEDVIAHTMAKGYKKIVLIGFSLGGSLLVKYLGENGEQVPSEVLGGVAISIPVQLESCAKKLSDPENKLYLDKFLMKLKTKIKLKATQFPEIFDLSEIDEISDFYNFDTRFSAPLYGFKSVEEFYSYASAGNYIEGIKLPTLLINSLNDPLFPEDCYPYKEAENHDHFYLETPKRGGHMGFWRPGQKESWAEKRALQFVKEEIGER